MAPVSDVVVGPEGTVEGEGAVVGPPPVTVVVGPFVVDGGLVDGDGARAQDADVVSGAGPDRFGEHEAGLCAAVVGGVAEGADDPLGG